MPHVAPLFRKAGSFDDLKKAKTISFSGRDAHQHPSPVTALGDSPTPALALSP
jgi:hypothetical protein